MREGGVLCFLFYAGKNLCPYIYILLPTLRHYPFTIQHCCLRPAGKRWRHPAPGARAGPPSSLSQRVSGVAGVGICIIIIINLNLDLDLENLDLDLENLNLDLEKGPSNVCLPRNFFALNEKNMFFVKKYFL